MIDWLNKINIYLFFYRSWLVSATPIFSGLQFNQFILVNVIQFIEYYSSQKYYGNLSLLCGTYWHVYLVIKSINRNKSLKNLYCTFLLFRYLRADTTSTVCRDPYVQSQIHWEFSEEFPLLQNAIQSPKTEVAALQWGRE